MNCFNIDPASGAVLFSSLVVCREGRCSFNLEGEYYELAKFSAIVLRKGQSVTDLRTSEDFSATCFEAQDQFLDVFEKSDPEKEVPEKVNLRKYNTEKAGTESNIPGKGGIEGNDPKSNIPKGTNPENNTPKSTPKGNGPENNTLKGSTPKGTNPGNNAPENNGPESNDRRTELFTRFKQLLKDHHTREHDALFYASQLHITPKYLALISKEASGLSVKGLIDRALLRDASFLLRHTDKTISQIAGALHFESPELFGKFFKRMSTFSPRQFRLRSPETIEQQTII